MQFYEYPELAFDILKNSINCNNCPPERNCCNNFSEKFYHELDEKEIKIIFGDKYKDLIKEGYLQPEEDIYRFTGGRCPSVNKRK